MIPQLITIKFVCVHVYVHECMIISLIDMISVQLGYRSLIIRTETHIYSDQKLQGKKAERAKFSAIRGLHRCIPVTTMLFNKP